MCLLAVHLLQCWRSLCLHPGNELLLLCFYTASLWLRWFLFAQQMFSILQQRHDSIRTHKAKVPFVERSSFRLSNHTQTETAHVSTPTTTILQTILSTFHRLYWFGDMKYAPQTSTHNQNMAKLWTHLHIHQWQLPISSSAHCADWKWRQNHSKLCKQNFTEGLTIIPREAKFIVGYINFKPLGQ